MECGCKVWYVDAEELENGIKDLIAAERGSAEFEGPLLLTQARPRVGSSSTASPACHQLIQPRPSSTYPPRPQSASRSAATE